MALRTRLVKVFLAALLFLQQAAVSWAVLGSWTVVSRFRALRRFELWVLHCCPMRACKWRLKVAVDCGAECTWFNLLFFKFFCFFGELFLKYLSLTDQKVLVPGADFLQSSVPGPDLFGLGFLVARALSSEHLWVNRI